MHTLFLFAGQFPVVHHIAAILAATFTMSAIIQFSVIIKVRSQHAVPVSVVRQWLDRHQTGVKKSSGSGQAIVRQWLGNQLRSQCTTVDSVSDIWPKIP